MQIRGGQVWGRVHQTIDDNRAIDDNRSGVSRVKVMYWEIRNRFRSNIPGRTHRFARWQPSPDEHPAFWPVSVLVHRLWRATVRKAQCYTLLAGAMSSEDRGAGRYGAASKRIV